MTDFEKLVEQRMGDIDFGERPSSKPGADTTRRSVVYKLRCDKSPYDREHREFEGWATVVELYDCNEDGDTVGERRDFDFSSYDDAEYRCKKCGSPAGFENINDPGYLAAQAAWDREHGGTE